MSLFSNLKTYSWVNCIDGKPFEIQVFARNPEEARREVFAIMAEIARIKPRYEALVEEIYRRYQELDDKKTTKTPLPVKKSWAQVTNGTSPVEKTIEQLREERKTLEKSIPADFFNGCFAASTFDYTADKVMDGYGGYDDQPADPDMSKTLGYFIQTTEPECSGPVRTVSFRSCLDG
jgi:hypothetical protein